MARSKKYRRTALTLFLTGLIINSFLLSIWFNYAQDASRKTFNARISETNTNIMTRLTYYEEVMLGAQGLLKANLNVSKDQWNMYASTVLADNKVPGIGAIGLAAKVAPQERETYMDLVRKAGLSDYKIFPESGDSTMYPILYIGPESDASKQAIGFNIASEDIRRKTIEEAVDSGKTTISEKLQLIFKNGNQNNNTPAFYIVVPVYAVKSPIDTVEQRRAAIRGVVYAGIRADNLLNNLIDRSRLGIDFDLYDGSADQSNFLYSTGSQQKGNLLVMPTMITDQQTINFGGKTLTVRYRSNEHFVENRWFSNKLLYPVLTTLITLLVSGVVYLLLKSRQQAVEIASYTANKLSESEERYKMVVNILQEGIILEDKNGKMLTYNESAYRILGFSSIQEAESNDSSSWTYVNENGETIDREKMPNHTVRQTGKPCIDTVIGVKRGDLPLQWLRISSLPIYEPGTKTLSHVVTSYFDITRQKNADEELKSLNKKLEQSNSELQDFAYISSHDLQEPLRKVIAFGEILQRKYKDILGEEGSGYIGKMQNASSRMSLLINDLLQFSRVTSQARPFESVDLNDIAVEVLSDLEIRTEEVHAHISVGDLPSIEADALQMRQLFQNLLSNSLKFRKHDTEPTINIYMKESKKNSNTVKIYFEDNGIGFDSKYKDKIFNIFQRLHTKSEYPGSGIGLSICRKIVDRHHGTIKVRSKVGVGTTFVIILPKTQSETE